MADWIWLNSEHYPALQTTRCTTFAAPKDAPYAMAEFRKEIMLRERPVRVTLTVSGDTKYWLWAEERFLGMGPVCAGGDYGNTQPMPHHYAARYALRPETEKIALFARVQLSPAVMIDYSCGHGGFYLEGRAEYADGTTEEFCTDESWQARLNPQYISARAFDYTRAPDDWMNAARVPSVWTLRVSPLPHLDEERLSPVKGGDRLSAAAGKTVEITVLFDRIYAGYIAFDLKAQGRCEITVTPFELEGQEEKGDIIIADGNLSHRGSRMYSVGGCHIRLVNHSGAPAEIERFALISTHYPVRSEGAFRCSDRALERVYDVCRHTLKICRQSLHLDSPRHQETLGCTGDYYIESLMTYFTFGDPRLIREDVIRTADWLNSADGFMFHTTYSLIWAEMLRELFMFTGDKALLFETRPALDRLLSRFADYVGESGLIETPPSWMFVDWITVDDLSMHHPPKALGQTVLTALYHRALNTAADIERRMGDECAARDCEARAEKVKSAFNALLYDKARGLYFDGLNTPQMPCTRPLPPNMTDVSAFMPQNVGKRYYSKQANTMAVLCGLCAGEKAQSIMRRVMEDETLIDFQPYFAHYVLDALWKTGLFNPCGMKLIDRWKPMIDSCDKGLQEGWIKPGGSYSFDHSHAWGGTPAYQLPCRLMGFEMLEPGFRKIALHPDAMGLDWAEIVMPTPFGPLTVALRDGGAEVEAPDEIEIEMR